MTRIPNVLTIAGTDPSGGAGISADLKTFSALGAFGTVVITAVVAQNTQGVREVTQLAGAQVRGQLDTLLNDVRIDALKIGMLGSAEVMDAVADVLNHHEALRGVPRVLDPVMVASSGDRLVDDDAVATLRERLIPAVDLVTPNLAEAGVLLGGEPPTTADEGTARRLLALGSGVLLKGGHGAGPESVDLLLAPDAPEPLILTAPRVHTRNTHGTGCTLSAAVTALRPQRQRWADAVSGAKDYLTAALQASDALDVGDGTGHGPVHHFHAMW